ncbi:MAG: hypothetical protein ACKV2T_23075 [Kofleriaceae bacterium]
MTAIRLLVIVTLAACGSSSSPTSVERTVPTVRDGAIAADATATDAARSAEVAKPIVDENTPATRVFASGTGRRLSGHTRASWLLDLPEMPWLRGTFVNMSLASYDGTTATGSVEMYAAPGLDPRDCIVEVVWDAQKKRGVQLRGAPEVEPINDQIGSRARWQFRARVDGAPPAAKATTFVFCPNDVMFYTIDMFAAGPKIREAFCKELRRDANRSPGGNHVGARTFDLAFACGVLVRQRGRELVDECKGDTLASLDELGADASTVAPAAGAAVTDEELRRLDGGGAECSRITLRAASTFPASAKQPFADFVKRAGPRLLGAFSRDGMRHR